MAHVGSCVSVGSGRLGGLGIQGSGLRMCSGCRIRRLGRSV